MNGLGNFWVDMTRSTLYVHDNAFAEATRSKVVIAMVTSHTTGPPVR